MFLLVALLALGLLVVMACLGLSVTHFPPVSVPLGPMLSQVGMVASAYAGALGRGAREVVEDLRVFG